MGYWGVKSYENDEAADALDAGFDRVHGSAYEALMDDRNPLAFEQVQEQLASAETLAAALAALADEIGEEPCDAWDDLARLAFAGVVVRHAELGTAIPEAIRTRAVDWLEHEDIAWPEATLRRLRRAREIAFLKANDV